MFLLFLDLETEEDSTTSKLLKTPLLKNKSSSYHNSGHNGEYLLIDET